MIVALLSIKKRKRFFRQLGLGEYNENNIRKLQDLYFIRTKDKDGKYGANTDKLLRHVYNVTMFAGSNFSPEEFRCGCGGRYCTGYPSYMRKTELANLKALREYVGKPIEITCGLRCRRFNDLLSGSSPNSAHLKGSAVDFYIKNYTTVLGNRRKLIDFIKELPFFNWAYCNGYSSIKNYNPKAPNMGSAIHFDSKIAPLKLPADAPIKK